MSEALYERYKDALRRGHIAALRGRNDAALGAYREAAVLAPDRPVPHVSMGAILLRLGRTEEAEAAFDVALARAPDDAAALAGRSEALVALDRPAEAAATLDRLAEVDDRSGRLAEACDAGRRALELAESRQRRRYLRDLARRLAESTPGGEAAATLAGAEAVLGRSTVEEPPAEADDGATGDDGAAAGPPDPLALSTEAEAAVAAGDAARAAGLLRAAIVAHRRLGQPNAALDVAVRALALEPVDLDLHVALAELYVERGWRPLAGEKLRLLARLATIAADDDARDRLRSVADEWLPDDAALAALLA
jgi:tetratricopeptide (TPR) repeat protein